MEEEKKVVRQRAAGQTFVGQDGKWEGCRQDDWESQRKKSSKKWGRVGRFFTIRLEKILMAIYIVVEDIEKQALSNVICGYNLI